VSQKHKARVGDHRLHGFAQIKNESYQIIRVNWCNWVGGCRLHPLRSSFYQAGNVQKQRV